MNWILLMASQQLPYLVRFDCTRRNGTNERPADQRKICSCYHDQLYSSVCLKRNSTDNTLCISEKESTVDSREMRVCYNISLRRGDLYAEFINNENEEFTLNSLFQTEQ